jgi:hypothetical protein
MGAPTAIGDDCEAIAVPPMVKALSKDLLTVGVPADALTTVMLSGPAIALVFTTTVQVIDVPLVVVHVGTTAVSAAVVASEITATVFPFTGSNPEPVIVIVAAEVVPTPVPTGNVVGDVVTDVIVAAGVGATPAPKTRAPFNVAEALLPGDAGFVTVMFSAPLVGTVEVIATIAVIAVGVTEVM